MKKSYFSLVILGLLMAFLYIPIILIFAYGFVPHGVSMSFFGSKGDFLGFSSKWIKLIFSNHYKEIGDYINREMGRGVTALKAIGWYTQEDRRVLVVMLRKTELPVLVKAVKSVDPKAFVTVVPANNVYGEGFDEMKTGIPKIKKENK